MQNKGAIRLFAIVLGIVCLYQLSFTFITRSVEADAREFAGGDTAKERQYLDSIKNKEVINYLWLQPYTYEQVKKRELLLGLDLQGGMNITLEVNTGDIIKSLANNSADPSFNKALKLAEQKQANSDQDFVTLFGEAVDEITKTEGKNDKWLAAPSIFGTAKNSKINPYSSTNKDVIEFLKVQAADAIDQTFQVLRTRIDKFGVTSPNIQKIGTSGRILVELPGVKDKARVRKLLVGTANLEFWETYENKEIYPIFNKADAVAKTLVDGAAVAAVVDTAKQDSNKVVAPATAQANADSAKKPTGADTMAKAGAKKDSAAAPTDTLSAEERRAQNPLLARIIPSIFTNPQTKQQEFAEGSCVGYVLLSDTAFVNKMLAAPEVKALFPANLRFYWGAKAEARFEGAGANLDLHAIKVTSSDGSPALPGDVITDATNDYQQNTGRSEVNMKMSPEGAVRWKRLTAANVGKSIAVVLDGVVYSSPTVKGEIPNGQSNISGNFTVEDAKDLANILKAGKMPATARIVQDVVVGPSLGQEAINNGFFSFMIALALILLFMGFYYNNSGWVADIALFVNLFYIMGILTSIGAVLTLPGIAGLVLTVGMSVDANVLIYERIREELRHGKGIRLAISDGFKAAYSSIIDSQVTTLIAGVVLYIYGVGPIKGFATTLVIGILSSLFASIFISRLIFEWMLGRNWQIKFSTKATENAFRNIKWNWIGKRKVYYIISGVITLAGIISLATRGLNYGVDFTGGRSYVVRFENDVETENLSGAMAASFGGFAPEVKTFGAANQVKITTKYKIEDNSENAGNDVEKALADGLAKAAPGNKFQVMSSDTVGPTVADDIKRTSVFAFILAVVGIFLYIVVRFRSWEYGLGAVIALIHDSFFVLSCFSIFYGILPFNLEIDQAFIAAVLTVMGYSINDTVVVFDRIREFREEQKNREVGTIINDALNSTLSRTILTSLTIFLVLFAIFIFGGEVIRGFSFALLMGIIIGTYSSLCVATPIVVDFRRRGKKADKAPAAVK